VTDRVLTPTQIEAYRRVGGIPSEAAKVTRDVLALCDSHERLRAERDLLRAVADAAWTLLHALEAADANEDLGFDDMEKVNALRWAFPKCERCNGHGSFDGLPHEDEMVQRCETCRGYGILRAAVDAFDKEGKP